MHIWKKKRKIIARMKRSAITKKRKTNRCSAVIGNGR
jgi:hypothetical protein